MIRRPPRSTRNCSSAASDVYKRQLRTQTADSDRQSNRIHRVGSPTMRRGAARHGTARHGSSTLAARRRTGGRIDQRPRRGLPACCDPSFTVPDNYHRHHRHYYCSDSITRRLLLPAVLLLRGFARSSGKLLLGRQSCHFSSSSSSLS